MIRAQDGDSRPEESAAWRQRSLLTRRITRETHVPGTLHDPTNLTLLDSAIAAQQRGELQIAIGLYRRLLRTDPDLAGALNNLGVALIEFDQGDEAIELLKKAHRIFEEQIAFTREAKRQGVDCGNIIGASGFLLGSIDHSLGRLDGKRGVKTGRPTAYASVFGREPASVRVLEQLAICEREKSIMFWTDRFACDLGWSVGFSATFRERTDLGAHDGHKWEKLAQDGAVLSGFRTWREFGVELLASGETDNAIRALEIATEDGEIESWKALAMAFAEAGYERREAWANEHVDRMAAEPSETGHDREAFRQRVFSGQIEAALAALSRATNDASRKHIIAELRRERLTLRESIRATSSPAPELAKAERRVAEILAEQAKRWFDEMEAKDLLWSVALYDAPLDIQEERARRSLAALPRKKGAANPDESTQSEPTSQKSAASHQPRPFRMK